MGGELEAVPGAGGEKIRELVLVPPESDRLSFQKKATDPARFTNRGGNLLKEEKQRSELHKNLPKVGHRDLPPNSKRLQNVFINCLSVQLEKKLKAEIDVWESEQGQEFLVNGQKFLQYVEEQWELHRVEKEKEKAERVRPSQPVWFLRNVLSSCPLSST